MVYLFMHPFLLLEMSAMLKITLLSFNTVPEYDNRKIRLYTFSPHF